MLSGALHRIHEIKHVENHSIAWHDMEDAAICNCLKRVFALADDIRNNPCTV